MKKLLIFLIIIFIIVIIVCKIIFQPNKGKVICTNYIIDNDISINTRYEISYKEKNVENIKTIEKAKFNDSKLLKEYKEVLEATYSSYQNLEYYSNSIIVKNNTIISTTNINYEKIDLDKFFSIDHKNKSLFKDGKIPLNKIKTIYQESGAVCK